MQILVSLPERFIYLMLQDEFLGQPLHFRASSKGMNLWRSELHPVLGQLSHPYFPLIVSHVPQAAFSTPMRADLCQIWHIEGKNPIPTSVQIWNQKIIRDIVTNLGGLVTNLVGHLPTHVALRDSFLFCFQTSDKPQWTTTDKSSDCISSLLLVLRDQRVGIRNKLEKDD